MCYRAAHGRVLRELVSNDDQPKIAVLGMIFQIVAQDREGFHQARDIFMDTDRAGEENVGIGNRITVKNLAFLGGDVIRLNEAGYSSAVDRCYPRGAPLWECH